MTFTNDGLTIANIATNDLCAATFRSQLSTVDSLSSSVCTSSNIYIPRDGFISFGDHSFSAKELGALFHYLQQLHPESQI